MTDADVATTHAEGCWAWGQKHHACAVREIERLRARIRDLESEIVRLREALSPEVTREAPCPICRRKTWRYAINDALGLDEPYAGDALERAVKCIRGLRDLAARVNEIPGLTAALDAARYERDVALGKTTEREQALREIERLVKENEGLRRGMSQMQLLAGLPLPPDVARDARLGARVREAAERFADADDIALTEDVSIYDDPRHSDALRTVLVIDHDQHAFLAEVADAVEDARETRLTAEARDAEGSTGHG